MKAFTLGLVFSLAGSINLLASEPCQKQLVPQPAELYRAASTRIVMSNGSSDFMIAIPNTLLPLQA